ncbi:protein-L-isoaspartate O-methyltransferase [Advenella sp. S44]|uniref:protein-L-isoaspartate(D-aspartate) O-methyltransferase n=1 Tax=Advenella sp. S44 TaxID=1982755 RepID=UPI000C2AAD98|nr:protein-L-isoaspartate(D-aspartate) O-methyltransferase [Advenella sp. S44]PJX23757.1 protein-L-isoaspartate O-methyltransferase [Advenella sp. S44]
MRKPPYGSSSAFGNVNDVNESRSRLSFPSNKIKITPTNSNTRIIVAGNQARPASPTYSSDTGRSGQNIGLNSERLRAVMVERLRTKGITDERVLEAMRAVPRHEFIDPGLISRAYDDAALPIGSSQTISQPWVVSRMLSAVAEGRQLQKMLEIGTGCGYQAAVMAGMCREVYTIERIKPLYEMARATLRELKLISRVRLVYGDGMLGMPSVAPFDAIVIAAAGLQIPPALLHQLDIGARLIAPEGSDQQKLVLIERTGVNSWDRKELEPVRFVPLRAGIQS